MSRKVLLYIAMSLDGYIAKNDDNIDFLSSVETLNEDYGYSDFIKNVDTVILGRRTYDKVKTFGIPFPHKDKKVFVLSRSLTGKDEHVVFVNDVKGLIQQLKIENGKDIYCDGGSELVFELLKYSVIDSMIISIIPYLLGNGIKLFKDGHPEQKLIYKRCISYPTGLVQIWYDLAENKD